MKRKRIVKRSRVTTKSNFKRGKPTVTRTKVPTVTGKIFIFGSNEIGQLGFNPEIIGTVKRPRVLEDLVSKNIVALSVSSLHNVAINNLGKVYSWGCNDEGALGRNTDETEEFHPAQVEGVDDVVIVKAACGDNITFLLSDEGVLYAAGTYFDGNGQLGFSQEQLFQRQRTFTKYKPVQHLKFSDVTCGENHTLAITRNNELYVWGWGEMFQLGRRFNPRVHGKGSGLAPERIMKNIKKIFCGSWNSFVIDQNDKLYVWGLNNYGQCGFNPRKKESIVTPTLLNLGYDGTIKEIAAGQHHTVVLFEDGKMFSFGRCDDGQLGIGDNIMLKQSFHAFSEVGKEPPSIDNSDNNSNDNRDDNNINSVSNSSAESSLSASLNNNTTTTTTAKDDDKKIDETINYRNVKAWNNSNIAISYDKLVWSWGAGESYNLGHGQGRNRSLPHKITSIDLSNHQIIDVGVGSQHGAILAHEND